MSRVRRMLAPVLLAARIGAAAGAGVTEAAPRPLVVVVRHGGLCVTGRECRTVLRITDTTISGYGFRPRRLSPTAHRSLTRAIGELDAAYLRRHPFTGTCPIAYDGEESIYRFRGFAMSIALCRHDVRRARAVQLTEHLLATLKPR